MVITRLSQKDDINKITKTEYDTLYPKAIIILDEIFNNNSVYIEKEEKIINPNTATNENIKKNAQCDNLVDGYINGVEISCIVAYFCEQYCSFSLYAFSKEYPFDGTDKGLEKSINFYNSWQLGYHEIKSRGYEYYLKFVCKNNQVHKLIQTYIYNEIRSNRTAELFILPD